MVVRGLIDRLKNDAVRHYKGGSYSKALDAAIRASNEDPHDAAIRNLAGAIALDIGDETSAIKYLSESLALKPQQAGPQYLIGNAFLQLSLLDQAVTAYRKSLSIDSQQPDVLVNLGIAYRRQAKHHEAERNVRLALDKNPEHPEGNNVLAVILDTKNQSDIAEPYARQALELNPAKVEYAMTYAKVLRNLRRYGEAEQVFKAALAYKPNDPDLLCSIGTVLREQNQFDAATKHYQRALELAPRSAAVLRAAADFFRSNRDHRKAVDAYERLIEVSGDADVGAYNNLAISLRDLDRFDDAETMYLKCVEIEERNAFGYNNLAILAMEMGKGVESIEYYQKAIQQDPDYPSARSNMLFYMNYLSEYSPKELFEAHLNWSRFHAVPRIDGTNYHPNDPDPDRKLKIGYISADFYGHAVSYFIDAALKHHDRENFHLTCYAFVSTPDAVTKRIKGYVEQFRYIHQIDRDEIDQLIRDDEIDILIDLSGHTAGNQLAVLSMKPAPIQVTWIGYPNTTGLSEVDYRFVDSITDPEGLADEIHTEKLWRLPRSFTCYTPTSQDKTADVSPVVKNGYVTFGSFNNSSKISSETVAAWSEVLKAVPGSKLILKSASLADEGTRERYAERFGEHGIDADRIQMLGRIEMSKHMELYGQVDIGLDPFPYNGTTTSCEALWMGVPIVALAGNRHSARVTASLLHQVGLGELVAETLGEYVAVATKLASDTDRLTKIRRELRDAMVASPLCDGPGHTKEVEDALRTMWRQWCAEKDVRSEDRRAHGWPADAPYRPTIRLVNGLGNLMALQIIKGLSQITT